MATPEEYIKKTTMVRIDKETATIVKDLKITPYESYNSILVRVLKKEEDK